MIKPYGNLLLVRPIAPPAETASGLHLPESMQSQLPNRVEVVAVGTGEFDPEFGYTGTDTFKEGQVLWIRKYQGDEVVVNGEKLIMLPTAAVLAIENEG